MFRPTDDDRKNVGIAFEKTISELWGIPVEDLMMVVVIADRNRLAAAAKGDLVIDEDCVDLLKRIDEKGTAMVLRLVARLAELRVEQMSDEERIVQEPSKGGIQ